MSIMTGAARVAAGLGCGLAIGGGTFALAQDPIGDIGIGVPAGTVSAFAGSDAPSGWLVADGSEVSRSAYPALFAAIGTRYGAGNGSTTFNLPDLRGRINVGRGTASEVDTVGENDGLALAARKVSHRHGRGTLGTDAAGAHNHYFQWGGYGSGGYEDADVQPHYWAAKSYFKYTNTAGNHTHPLSGEVGDTTGPLDRPAYNVVNYVIKG